MTTIHTLVLIAHVLIGAAIVGLVLLQRGKGAEAGAAFGAGVSGTIFGARGSANFLSRSTAVLATLFFVTSLSLAYLGAQRRPAESLLDQPAAAEGAPAAPAPALVPPPGEAPALPVTGGTAPAAPEPSPEPVAPPAGS